MSTPPLLSFQTLNSDVAAAPQLLPEAMAEVAAAGFRSIVNNRPDGEGGPQQPTDARMREAAQAAGLVYAYLPVAGAYQTPEQIAAMADLLVSLPRPALLFCRSGARSAKLYMAAQQLVSSGAGGSAPT